MRGEVNGKTYTKKYTSWRSEIRSSSTSFIRRSTTDTNTTNHAYEPTLRSVCHCEIADVFLEKKCAL